MKTINFTCPKCGHKKLYVQYASVELFDVIYLATEYDEPFLAVNDLVESISSECQAVVCAKCRHEIGKTEEEAIDWLELRGMLSKETR